MRRTKFQPPPHKEGRRDKWRRFRVNDEEGAYIDGLAEQAGYGNVSDFLRASYGLQSLRPGAPLGNKNKAGKKGANRHTKRGT